RRPLRPGRRADRGPDERRRRGRSGRGRVDREGRREDRQGVRQHVPRGVHRPRRQDRIRPGVQRHPARRARPVHTLTRAVAAAAAAALTACGPAAPAAPPGTATGTVPAAAPPTVVYPPTVLPSVVETAASWTMPNLVGEGLQDAQDAIQELTGYRIVITTSHDA